MLRTHWHHLLLAFILLLAGTSITCDPFGRSPQPAQAASTAGQTTRVSVASDGSHGNGNSTYPSISADGRFVAFTSSASNLVSGDTNGTEDIFIHDRQIGQTTRVSVASDGSQGNGSSSSPSISADGRFVAFTSNATNLVSGGTQPRNNIFVHDEQTGLTSLISIASDGSEGNGLSRSPSISADGRFVAFVSYAANLVSGDTIRTEDIFIHDRQTGQNEQVSIASGHNGDGNITYPSISADGRFVAFNSDTTNLVIGDTNGVQDIFVHDRQTGETTRVSVASDGSQGNGMSEFSSISVDGRLVVFDSASSNLVSGDTNGTWDVFVHDRQNGQTSQISVASNGDQGDSMSYYPEMSPNGRFVTFQSESHNLVSGDTNGAWDGFVFEIQTNHTSRVSVDSEGSQGNGNSGQPSISANGRFVAFSSKASNLVSGDNNVYQDVFVHDRCPDGSCDGTNPSVSGRVTSGTGLGLPDVTLSITSDSAISNSNGDYTISGVVPGDYTLTPIKAGCTFTPSAILITITDADILNQNFTATCSSSTTIVSGKVTGHDSKPLSGAAVKISARPPVQVNESGAFSVELPSGTYTLTPSKPGYVFEPSSRVVTLPDPGLGSVNFSASSTRPPVVLVHGWQGFPKSPCTNEQAQPDEYFERLDEDIEALGYAVGFAYLESSCQWTPSFDTNVAHVMSAIDRAKGSTGQNKVILIGHSMGGLVGRAYLEGDRYRDDVKTFITLGSPHLGVPVDVISFLTRGQLGEYCDISQPALCQFSASGMALFNLSHHPRSDQVDYQLVSGATPLDSAHRNLLAMAVGYLIPVNDDGTVPTDSGLGLDGVSRFETEENHRLLGPNDYFSYNGGKSISLESCLAKLITGTGECTQSRQALKPESPEASLEQHSPLASGSLAPGAQANLPFALEGGSTVLAVSWVTGTIEVTLVNPAGDVIDPAYAAAHPDQVTFSLSDNQAMYSLSQAAAGQWQLVLQADPTAAEDVPYTAFAAFTSPVGLTSGIEKDWYSAGATAALTATHSGPVSTATIQAQITYADGSTQTVSIPEIGAGQYRGEFKVSSVSGYAQVNFLVTGTTNGNPFQRGESRLFQVTTPSIALNGAFTERPIPGNDARYSGLEIVVGVTAPVSGTYSISADLVDLHGNLVARSGVTAELPAGDRMINLPFDGASIFAAQMDGPYWLTNLVLIDQSKGGLVSLSADNVYQTAAYPYQDFGHQAERIRLFIPFLRK